MSTLRSKAGSLFRTTLAAGALVAFSAACAGGGGSGNGQGQRISAGNNAHLAAAMRSLDERVKHHVEVVVDPTSMANVSPFDDESLAHAIEDLVTALNRGGPKGPLPRSVDEVLHRVVFRWVPTDGRSKTAFDEPNRTLVCIVTPGQPVFDRVNFVYAVRHLNERIASTADPDAVLRTGMDPFVAYLDATPDGKRAAATTHAMRVYAGLAPSKDRETLGSWIASWGSTDASVGWSAWFVREYPNLPERVQGDVLFMRLSRSAPPDFDHLALYISVVEAWQRGGKSMDLARRDGYARFLCFPRERGGSSLSCGGRGGPIEFAMRTPESKSRLVEKLAAWNDELLLAGVVHSLEHTEAFVTFLQSLEQKPALWNQAVRIAAGELSEIKGDAATYGNALGAKRGPLRDGGLTLLMANRARTDNKELTPQAIGGPITGPELAALVAYTPDSMRWISQILLAVQSGTSPLDSVLPKLDGYLDAEKNKYHANDAVARIARSVCYARNASDVKRMLSFMERRSQAHPEGGVEWQRHILRLRESDCQPRSPESGFGRHL